MNNIRKSAIILCFITLVMAVGCGGNTPAISTEDEASIYAAVVRQLATVDDTFGGSLKSPTLYVIRNTDDKAGDLTGQGAESKTIPQAVQDIITDNLQDLSSTIIWKDKFDDAEFEKSKLNGLEGLKDGGAIITLGNIHLQDDGSAQLAGSIYVASLAAGGSTYVLEKKDGFWEITGKTGVRWIS